MEQNTQQARISPRRMEKERLEFHQLLQQNPNYFGQLKESKFQPVEEIHGNTTFEQLICVGLYPERNTVEAILQVKLPYGFGGDLCHHPTHEYVHFYLDWDRDGDFDAPIEDLGIAVLEVHDISEVQEGKPETYLCYAVARPFKTLPSSCEEPYIIRLRAVMAWEQIPTSPDFPMVWGNIVECLVQVDPEGTIQVVSAPQVGAQATAAEEQKTQIDPHRTEFLKLLAENPNFFGTAPASSLPPSAPKEFDTSFEELKCLGLYPEENLLEAIFEVKLPIGFDGPLCSPGSHEFVRFFVDWDNDGDFSDPGESVGFATVRVHDIPEVKAGDPKTYICYATSRPVQPPPSTCQSPLIVPARAVLSWQVLPPGPNGPVVWGNIVQCMVQFRPTQQPLMGQITAPVNDACVGPVVVPSCVLDGHPLSGIQITGSAGGSPFNHYPLRYTWAANPLINDAVVYPNCVRATPIDPGASVPVNNGVLGYLDVSLLPAGVTEFTIRLDVFPTAGPSLSATGSFKLRESDVYIDEVATQPVVYGPDPFHPLTSAYLLKHTMNVAVSVPEQSVGGSFSIHGSAYVVGCDRIISQYDLFRFNAPPANPVPTFPSGSGGTTIMPAVVYDNTPAHPWKWVCVFPPPSSGTNIIENGNLVAGWGTHTCPSPFPPGFYPVNKVNDFAWNSRTAGPGGTPLNGRYVLLLEVQDVPVGMPGPVNTTVDQVAVWIDNFEPLAYIASIGGKVKCDDIHLKDYLSPRVKADFTGKAWDPPIDPTAPQQAPNDNFGGYSLGFFKNGGIPGPAIPGSTPNSRVGTPAWPVPPTVDGLLAQWDIVVTLDAGNAPTPYVDPGFRLYRGERCAFVFTLNVNDTTWVGDSGSNHTQQFSYAVTIINDIPATDPFPEPSAP